MHSLQSAVLATVLLCSSSGAQICLAAHPSMGQPTLAGVRPVCFDTVSVTRLNQLGNPGFQMASFAPAPVTPGSPTWLVFYLNQTPLDPAPGLVEYCLGEVPLIPSLTNIVTVFAGPAGATPGTPVPIPLPRLFPGGPFRVHTVGIDAGACVFATDGISLTRATTPSLWVADDVQRRISEVLPNGQVLGMFDASTDVSCVAVDWMTDTLWTTSEGLDMVINFSKSGELLSQFSTLEMDPQSTQPEGIDIDPVDGTLWLVDDTTLRVYNVDRNGTVLSSFFSTDFHALALSPQDVACAPDGTLWITDNSSDRIYHVTTTGTEISRFAANRIDPALLNPQGISVDRTNGTLWITGRDTSRVYNVTTGGDPITRFVLRDNPTGVASTISVTNS